MNRMWAFFEWFEPHLTWLLGVALILDAVFWQQWVDRLATEPRAFLLVFGTLVFISGRAAIRERKRKHRMQREMNVLKKERDEWKLAFEKRESDTERES